MLFNLIKLFDNRVFFLFFFSLLQYFFYLRSDMVYMRYRSMLICLGNAKVNQDDENERGLAHFSE